MTAITLISTQASSSFQTLLLKVVGAWLVALFVIILFVFSVAMFALSGHKCTETHHYSSKDNHCSPVHNESTATEPKRQIETLSSQSIRTTKKCSSPLSIYTAGTARDPSVDPLLGDKDLVVKEDGTKQSSTRTKVSATSEGRIPRRKNHQKSWMFARRNHRKISNCSNDDITVCTSNRNASIHGKRKLTRFVRSLSFFWGPRRMATTSLPEQAPSKKKRSKL